MRHVLDDPKQLTTPQIIDQIRELILLGRAKDLAAPPRIAVPKPTAPPRSPRI
jgi:hypothetical protein